MEFKDLGLHKDLLKAVHKLGFEVPSEIQEKAIPILSGGEQDFVGLAQTGTCKTAAFVLRHAGHSCRYRNGHVYQQTPVEAR